MPPTHPSQCPVCGLGPAADHPTPRLHRLRCRSGVCMFTAVGQGSSPEVAARRWNAAVRRWALPVAAGLANRTADAPPR
jgi:hypothetical protein